jgi:hypothetical protein
MMICATKAPSAPRPHCPGHISRVPNLDKVILIPSSPPPFGLHTTLGDGFPSRQLQGLSLCISCWDQYVAEAQSREMLIELAGPYRFF